MSSEELDIKPEDLLKFDYDPPKQDWMDPSVAFRKGTYCYSCAPKHLEYLEMANPREWQPHDKDWKLPENWKEIVFEGMRDRLSKYRSFQLFMDICVRCGACADKCHFFIGSGDPKNMPVLRAELLRSVYRNDFTAVGKILGKLAGGRELTEDVIKEWFYYFYQCTECRRCSVFCPYGIDTAEITMMARELLNLLGLKISKKGADVLFVTPSGDYFADPGTFTLMGYMMLFHEIGLDYTWSPYASEGGNFGLFNSNELMKQLNAKIYLEAKRLGVKWILGGECGHMWRVVNQYMDTMNGPADFLEEPVSPITGTKFENAKSTKMVHIAEFTADLMKHNKVKLDPSRNDSLRVTFHDSCNPARAMGILEEPRYVLNSVCNHFYEMPENTIREQTYCCAGGAGLGTDENMEMRMRGGFPRGNALRHVQEKHDVNRLACVCAIDRATLIPLADYWARARRNGKSICVVIP